MNFNKHWQQEGKHAFLSASKYSWINYSEEHLLESYRNYLAVQRGTRLHAFAAECINLGQTLPKTRSHITLNEYVNDAIGYRMTPEQVLYYSDNAFGTTDSISFRNNILRISDLKTGANPAHMEQLYIYAALFCLEYKMNPEDLDDIILRIYQNNDILEEHADPKVVRDIMAKTILFDKLINDMLKGD